MYVVALYITIPFSSSVDVAMIIAFFVIIEEDSRFALAYAFLAGLITDLYFPVRLGISSLINIVLTQSLIVLKKYLVLNPLTTIATFIVFYFVRTALLNIFIASPISLVQISCTILAFFPTLFILKRIVRGPWMKK
ncbi:MAG: rod shape-determining protein MreD [candidate division WOR-3 bacterium]|nr:MAG: rod shape-determining protein MreD [candidate division WOR-3 bacterium]